MPALQGWKMRLYIKCLTHCRYFNVAIIQNWASFYNFSYFFFWLWWVACRILAPQPGMEPGLPALGMQSFSHWTTREVPELSIFDNPSRVVVWEKKRKARRHFVKVTDEAIELTETVMLSLSFILQPLDSCWKILKWNNRIFVLVSWQKY